MSVVVSSPAWGTGSSPSSIVTISCLQGSLSEGQDAATGLSPEARGGHGARSPVTPGEPKGGRGRATCRRPRASEAAAAPDRAISGHRHHRETVLVDSGQKPDGSKGDTMIV